MDPTGDNETLLRRVLAERVRLLGFLRALVRQRDLAEDLFQDLCVLVLQKRDEVMGVSNLPAWLRTAGRQLAMNALRKRVNRDLFLGDAVHDLLGPAWAEADASAPDAPSMTAALSACLDQLGAPARRLLEARHGDGKRIVDLAREQGRPVDSLYTTLSRVHRKLGECIQRRLRLYTQEVGHGQ